MNWCAMTHSTQVSPHRSAPEPIHPAGLDPSGRIGYGLKRPLDVALSLTLLILSSPVLMLIAILVRLTSDGPALFRQQRLGLDARPFTFYKFRTMRTGADERIHQDYVRSFIEGQPNSVGTPFKLQSDPRITPLGQWLRKTSLDELPQLFNVLRGDMSLVGPRPPLAYEVAQYQPWHMQRLTVAQPGVTGLWQVEGRSRVPFDEMVRMDLRYASTCSLWGDLMLLLRTVLVVFRGLGGA